MEPEKCSKQMSSRISETQSSSAVTIFLAFHVLLFPLRVQQPPSSVFLRGISKHRSRLVGYQGRRRCDRPLQRPVGWERRGAPVRLVEVDVKSPCPVGEDPLLRDEAVVAAPAPTLMRNVHGALIWTTWLVVVVGDGVVLRLPVVGGREERWLTFKNALMSHLSFRWHHSVNECFSISWWSRGTELHSFVSMPNFARFNNF